MVFHHFFYNLLVRYLFVFIVTFLFCVFPLFAKYRLPHKNFIPIRLGVNFNTILYANPSIQANYVTRFHVSIGYERILKRLGTSSVLSFGIDTFYVGRGVETVSSNGLTSIATIHTLSFPVSLRYGLTDFRSFFPYIHVGLSPVFRLAADIDGTTGGDTFNDGERAFSLFDVGFRVGLGVFWNKVMIEFSYELGLLDAVDEYIVSDYDMHSFFYISFGSRIGFKI